MMATTTREKRETARREAERAATILEEVRAELRDSDDFTAFVTLCHDYDDGDGGEEDI
jgi:hypothetical protein